MNLKKVLRNRIRNAQLAWWGRFGPLCAPDKWVFIVGCYNSGTTLLHDILASHPDVAHLPREGQYCTDQLLIPSEAGLARVWALQPERFIPGIETNPDAQRIQRQWCHLMQPPSRPVYLEKSIPNAGRIQWLQQHFPNAHFIALVRNGYAVAEGIRRKSGQPLERAAKQWQESNRIMLQQLQTVAHQRLLTYEQFTHDPQVQINRILDFLELEHRPDLPHQSWNIHGVNSTIRNMNPESLARLDADERALIEAEAGPMLQHFGYQP